MIKIIFELLKIQPFVTCVREYYKFLIPTLVNKLLSVITGKNTQNVSWRRYFGELLLNKDAKFYFLLGYTNY